MNSILIIGKPNSGKSLLFNRLTGLKQKVANFPGVTVEIKSGNDDDFNYADYPGIYSFQPLTEDENVSVSHFKSALKDDQYKAVVCTLDATRLERSLVMGLQVLAAARAAGKPVVFALNMMDEILSKKTLVDAKGLEQALSSPVVEISAKKNQGIDQLKQKLKEVCAAPNSNIDGPSAAPSTGDLIKQARDLNAEFGPSSALLLKSQNRWDRFFLSSWLGGILFSVIMLFIFQSIFTWSGPLMDGVETVISTLGAFFSERLPAGILRDFVNDALFGGFGSFLVFVPQIFILTLIIGILEDSGYLARAAVICHKPLNVFGLTGKSFVPLLSGHACAIPAIMAARTIESPKKRLLTMLTVPLTACSARLPVYSLLIVTLIPATGLLGGLLSFQGLAFFALYFLGIMMALLVAALLSKTKYQEKNDAPFILELPPYRLPHWQPLLQRSLISSWHFVSKAGLIIFVVTVFVWILGYFPGDSLQTSYLSQIGRWFEPIFTPLGLDWKYGVAILASFLAREVFVGTLGTMIGIEGADENIAGLASHLQASGLTLASGVALLVFYAIALQCVSTLAVLKKETGSYKLPVLTFVGYSVLAYALALFTYRVLA